MIIETLASAAALRYAKNSFDVDTSIAEFSQIARIAGYRAVVENYTPGRPVQSLVWVAMNRALRRESWAQRFIVSGFRHRGGAAMGTSVGWSDLPGTASPANADAPKVSGSAFVSKAPLPDAFVEAEAMEQTFRGLAGDAGFSHESVDVLLEYAVNPNSRSALWAEVQKLKAWAVEDKRVRDALIG